MLHPSPTLAFTLKKRLCIMSLLENVPVCRHSACKLGVSKAIAGAKLLRDGLLPSGSAEGGGDVPSSEWRIETHTQSYRCSRSTSSLRDGHTRLGW